MRGAFSVVTGDFFQLPPVPDWAAPGEKRQDSQFVFESQGWKQAVPEMVILTQ